MQPKYKAITLMRHPHKPYRRTLVLFAVFLISLLSPFAAKAQAPTSFWIPPYIPPSASAAIEDGTAETATAPGSVQFVIDTDPGVDDAVALAWLLSQPQAKVFGIVSVAGNTTVENATQNVFTILNQLSINNIPVIEGASKPMSQKLSSTGKLIHGEDGLWSHQVPSASTAHYSRSKEARNFYCSTGESYKNTTILALGPMTNLAQAIQHCPSSMRKYSRIVALGGAKFGGNTTPVAEFNIWQDPEAAQIVLKSGIKLELIPLDAFSQFALPYAMFLPPPFPPHEWSVPVRPVMQFLFVPLSLFAGVQAFALPPEIPLDQRTYSIPDLAAAMYALNGWATVPTERALVQVMDSPEAVRGQTIIGLVETERFTMIASQKEIDKIADTAMAMGTRVPFPNGVNVLLPDSTYLQRKIDEVNDRVPGNAFVIMDIDEDTMIEEFGNFLLTNATAMQSQLDPDSEQIYLPSISGE